MSDAGSVKLETRTEVLFTTNYEVVVHAMVRPNENGIYWSKLLPCDLLCQTGTGQFWALDVLVGQDKSGL